MDRRASLIPVDTGAAAFAVGVSPDTIRQWKRRGFLQALNTPAPGEPSMFDLAAVYACHAARRNVGARVTMKSRSAPLPIPA